MAWKDDAEKALDKQAADRGFIRDRGQSDSSPYSGDGDSTGCYAGDTQISVAGGSVRICDLTEGDYVLSWSSGSLVERRVTRVIHRRRRPVWETRFVDPSRKVMRSTKAHSLLTSEGWSMVYRLRQGSLLVTSHGDLAKVDKVNCPVVSEDVFNLVTEGERNFIANGIISHNFTFFRAVRDLYYMAIETRDKVFKPLPESDLKSI